MNASACGVAVAETQKVSVTAKRMTWDYTDWSWMSEQENTSSDQLYGDMGGGGTAPEPEPEPTPEPGSDKFIEKLKAGDPISLTVKGTSGKGSQSVVGTTDAFIVTTFDPQGKILSQVSCTRDTSWNVSFTIAFLKGFKGGDVGFEVTVIAGMTCTKM